MNHPIFSIIVPVYNVENYLDICVQSLIKQTFSNIEIILVDDGSSDRSGTMCDSYAAADPRIQVVHQTNAGLSAARNAGIAIAKGSYILLVDADDYIEPDTCEQFLPFTQQSYDIIAGSAISNNPHLKLTQLPDAICYDGKQYLKQALQRGSMPAAAWLYVYSRDFLERNALLFQPGLLHEDEHFTPRAFLCAKTVINTEFRFYHYVIRENSLTTAKDLRKNAEDLYSTCLELEQIYRELTDKTLQQLLLDSLVVKYLSLYQRGGLHRYGDTYTHKPFLRRNAYQAKTKLKVWLFCANPVLYWNINHRLKQRFYP